MGEILDVKVRGAQKFGLAFLPHLRSRLNSQERAWGALILATAAVAALVNDP
jgi:hypothetical protein